MAPGPPTVTVLSLGTTPGWRRADATLAQLLEAAGVRVQPLRVRLGAAAALRRHMALVDLVEGLGVRRTARAVRGDALIVSGMTSILLLRPPEVPWAVRFDAPTAQNRLGWSGAWQRAVERRRVREPDLLLPLGRMAAQAVAPLLAGRSGPPVVPVPVPVPDVPAAAQRDLDAAAYVGWPWKRGLDLLCRAWGQVGAGRRLVISPIARERALEWLGEQGVAEPPGVEWPGAVPHERWLAMVARARVFVNASRREDYGVAPLEALAAGTPLVTVPASGAYEALPLARELEPALVAGEVSAPALADALRAGLALDDAGKVAYAARAEAALAPYRWEGALRTVRDEVLPRLLARSR